MSIIGVVGSKHSPGATTLAVALACMSGPQERALLVEADPAGGDLAARTGRPLDPGLLSLAAAGRRGMSEGLLDAHTQTLSNGVTALLGPPSPEQAAAALTGIGRILAPVLAERRGCTVIDAGRWDPRSPARELLHAADIVLVAFRPTVEGVEHVRVRLAAIEALDTRLIAVSVGERPYSAREVAAVLAPVEVYAIEDDPRAARALAAGAPIDRWLRRSSMVRSIAALAEQLPKDRTEVRAG